MSFVFHNQLSVASWNINGLKSKIDNPDFIDLASQFDIIFYLESFADIGSENFVLDGFTSTNVAQSGKHKNATRNGGGISAFIKNEFSPHIKAIKSTAEHFIWLQISKTLTGLQQDIYCCGGYIQPSDSPIYKRLPDIDFFSLLGHDINKYKKRGHIMFTGDLNARIGKLLDCPPESYSPTEDDPLSHIETIDVPPRCTMDFEKNRWGTELLNLCYAHDLCLLNGRTLGDLKGQPTFFGNQFNSKKWKNWSFSHRHNPYR